MNQQVGGTAVLLRPAATSGVHPVVADTFFQTQSNFQWSSEDELFEMLDELPGRSQIENIVGRLRVPTLRAMAKDILSYNVAVAKDSSLYPYELTKKISEWIATAQEVVSSKGRVSAILQDRTHMRRNTT